MGLRTLGCCCVPPWLALGVDDPHAPLKTRIPYKATVTTSGARWTYDWWDGLEYNASDGPNVLHHQGVQTVGGYVCEDVPYAYIIPDCNVCGRMNNYLDCFAGTPQIPWGDGSHPIYPTMEWHTWGAGAVTYWPGHVRAGSFAPDPTGNQYLPDINGTQLVQRVINGVCSYTTGGITETWEQQTANYWLCEEDDTPSGQQGAWVKMLINQDTAHPDTNSRLEISAAFWFGGTKYTGTWNAGTYYYYTPIITYSNPTLGGIPIFRYPDSITFNASLCTGVGGPNTFQRSTDPYGTTTEGPIPNFPDPAVAGLYDPAAFSLGLPGCITDPFSYQTVPNASPFTSAGPPWPDWLLHYPIGGSFPGQHSAGASSSPTGTVVVTFTDWYTGAL
jgi:hypothetical protein